MESPEPLDEKDRLGGGLGTLGTLDLTAERGSSELLMEWLSISSLLLLSWFGIVSGTFFIDPTRFKLLIKLDFADASINP